MRHGRGTARSRGAHGSWSAAWSFPGRGPRVVTGSFDETAGVGRPDRGTADARPGGRALGRAVACVQPRRRGSSPASCGRDPDDPRMGRPDRHGTPRPFQGHVELGVGGRVQPGRHAWHRQGGQHGAMWDATPGPNSSFSAGTGDRQCGGVEPDGSRIATGSCDDTASVWDVRTEAAGFRRKVHGRGVVADVAATRRWCPQRRYHGDGPPGR